ncbi:isochorismatase family protein [Neisseria sp. 83E34]|uniref:isochorismatase family protein n=1 Tax=Neisseria sp. 83E34 TaxID=1692264 RepID=UPI0006CEA0C8|nr:isochorismatase family protein [Neisseria sp. 83E34]KPN71872.1 isochorismatase [Neisseria sp. 83E34]
MANQLKTNNTECIVVDIQERLMPALHASEVMLQSCTVLLKGLNKLNVPIQVTEQYPKGLGKTLPEIAELTKNAPVYEKTRFSAYLPEIEKKLANRQVRHVILIGAETHVCMLQTVLDLSRAGIQVYVPFECTSSRKLQNKDNALQQMRDAGAVVSNVESVLFQLLQDAKHEAFKEISGLIR